MDDKITLLKGPKMDRWKWYRPKVRRRSMELHLRRSRTPLQRSSKLNSLLSY